MANSNQIRSQAAARLRQAGEVGKQATQDWIEGVTEPISDYLGMAADVLEGEAELKDLIATTFALWIETAHATCSSYHALCQACTDGGDGGTTTLAVSPEKPTFTIDDHAEAADAVALYGLDPAELADFVASNLTHVDGTTDVPHTSVSLTTYAGNCCVSLRDLRNFERKAGLYRGVVRRRSTGAEVAPISLLIKLHHAAV
jgi:hypothetical protein